MELHAIDWLRAVRDRHDVSVVAARRDGDLGRQAFLAHDQGMVPPRFERIPDSGEEFRAVVENPGRLSVAGRAGPFHGSAVERRDRLMSQADPQQGDLRALGRRDRLERPARVLRPAGAG